MLIRPKREQNCLGQPKSLQSIRSKSAWSLRQEAHGADVQVSLVSALGGGWTCAVLVEVVLGDGFAGGPPDAGQGLGVLDEFAQVAVVAR